MDYDSPEIKDDGDLRDLTSGCLGSTSADTFGDTLTFPAGPSGALICP
jgi:hypothetical protein